MSSFWNQRRAGIAALLCQLLAAPYAVNAEIDPISRSVEEPALVRFQYRLYPQAEVEKIEVTQEGKALAFRQAPFGNNPLNTSAILVLVDTSAGTSKAPRDRTLADNKQWINALLSQAQSRHLIGVYGFANDLVEIAPVGEPFAEIRRKIEPLKANGMGTRLYRRGMDAVEALAQTGATRRALVILSDGKDEDTGFTKDDLIQAAKRQSVVVFALGCPETATEIPALGNLEKIAAETHGLYAQAGPGTAGSRERARTDAEFAKAVLDSIDAGEEILIPLETADPAQPIQIDITTKAGEKFSRVHERAAPQPAAGTAPAQPPPGAAPALPPKAAAIPAARPKPWIERNGLYLAEAAAIVLLAAAGLWLRRKRQTPPPAAEQEPEPPKPLAFLEMQDADSSRVPVLEKASRIGRNPGNDIVFANTSVSGFHAEIHAKRDGTFYISDLGSGNGVLVNSRQIAQSADLKEGDLVELGEVRFRFRLS